MEVGAKMGVLSLAEVLDQSALTQILNYVCFYDISALVETGDHLLFQKMTQCRLNIFMTNLTQSRKRGAHLRLGSSIISYEDVSNVPLKLSTLRFFTRLVSLSMTTFFGFELVGAPETITTLTLNVTHKDHMT